MDLLISSLKPNLYMALQEQNYLNTRSCQLQKVCKTGVF